MSTAAEKVVVGRDGAVLTVVINRRPLATSDAREGFTALLERRPPVFTGL
ncbi:hypothetical protein [Streptomyces sp. NPDC001139]